MAKEAGLEEPSLRTPVTDLLRRFGMERCRDAALIDCASGEEVELGLSLGGCFGAEPENQLVRASSIFGLSMHDDAIARTCSVPKNSEEEHRKRKGLQSLKRLEVKQRRLEKWELRTGAKHDANRGAVDGLRRFQSISQLSVGSQSSSCLSDLDCRLEHVVAGSNSCKEVKIPPSSITSSSCKEVKISPLSIPLELNQANTIRSIKEGKQSKKKLEIVGKPKELERNGMEEVSCKLSKEKLGTEFKAKELERSRMAEMPCVSARGKDPNGRIIRGLLYQYENGMDVRIVCMCHGCFLTPAEFVKHAGGGDVAHPLRHIIVSHLPFAL